MSNDEPQSLPKRRIMSIDALRGFDMFWIIGGQTIFHSLHKIFNNSKTAWINQQLSHVEWEGFRPWDLIMPLFLFVVGAVMPFAFNKRLARGDSKRQLYFHVVKRTVILWVLGMIAQGHLLEYDLSTLQVYSNTLQAIAAGYFISAILILNMRLVGQVLTTAILLLVFWALMMLVPVPGQGQVSLASDANLALHIDKFILGPYYGWGGYTWILSSMTFACTVMLGVMAGHLLRSEKSDRAKVLWLLATGVGCLVLSCLWDIWFPVIKRIWSSSFVLYSGGLCYLLLALFYLVIDVWGFKKWAFGFVVIGANAITVYMLTRSSITRHFDFRRIGDIFVTGLDRSVGDWGGLIHAVAGFAALWLVLWWMYRKKLFVKI
jgi:predicted acyltransferase